jgi:hypothetical protein
MSRKTAKADLTPVRQRTQYTCMSTSMMMCLRALGHDCNEDEVNKVMGARPMKGAAWEQALACAQHYGVRATLTTPSTVRQLKAWTDAGKPVMIAWNPEGREWSHASVVFDVDDDLNVYVADPNIPDPDETVRVVSKGDFYKKWYEKWPNYLVRRPALMLDREITADGRQVMASRQKNASQQRFAEEYDRQRDRALERGTYRRRAPQRPYTPPKTNPSRKIEKRVEDSIEAGGLKIGLTGEQHADGLIGVTLTYPLGLGIHYKRNPVHEEISRLARSDRSWVAQGTMIARRRYWLKDAPDQYGGWPEVRNLNQAMRDVKRVLSKIKPVKAASRRGPPSQMGSSALLKRKGYTPVDVMFGEALPHRRPIVSKGDGIMDRRGDVYLFAGIAGDGSPILAKDERELERLSDQIVKDRLHVVTASAKRVASAFARRAAQARIDNDLKRKINARMRRLGLDGNGRFRKPDRGFAAAVDAMQKNGVTLDSVVSAFEFSARPSGTVRADIAFIDESQPYAPGITISNSILYLQYTEVSDDRFEVVAYLS